MKKKLSKKEWGFLLLLVVLAAAIGVAGVYLEDRKPQTPGPGELPEEADTSVYSKLVISEVVTNNGGIYVNEKNACCDYAEIYNGTRETINLMGYGLSDRADKVKWSFPDVKIGAGEYLVINLTGKEDEGLNASFKLASKGGEELILVNKSGKVIDAVKTVAMSKNQSMVRDNTEWRIVSYATPGYENSMAGFEAYRESLKGEEDGRLVVNEFLCKNSGNYINENGRRDGFVELKNISKSSLNLSEYCLSNDLAVPFKYNLPAKTLASGEIFFLYTGDSSSIYENYLGFSLDSKQGSLIISKDGKILKEFDYEDLPNGSACVRAEDGSYYYTAAISPGFENTADGVEAFQKQSMPVPKGLILSELMNSNSKYLVQNGDRYYDWIELYNNSDAAIKLSDYCVTTSMNDPCAFRLPEKELAPGEYYVFMCSGNEALTNDSYIHAGFSLGKSESVYLTKDSKAVDSVYLYGIPLGYSYSRGETYGWRYCDAPTPGKKNNSGLFAVTPSPEILLPAGIYNGVSTLSVEISGQGKIYYTVDGSVPTTKSKVYTEPISIKKTTSIKAIACIDGEIPSSYVCSSYIVNDPHEVPVAVLSMDPSQYTYLYNHPFRNDLGYTGYFEFYEESGSCAAPCGVGFNGYTGRRYAKKNYALRFEGEYGAKDLNYKVFDDLDCSRFDVIVVRGGSNAEMKLPWKDEFATTLARDYLQTRAYKTCVFYVNGEYKGIFNLREKINAEFIVDNYNVDKERVSLVRWDSKEVYGEDVWGEIMNWGINHDLSKKENYDYFCSRVNVTQLCDLWIFQAFMNNPDISNVRVFSHPDIDNGRCQFIFYDLDLGFYGKYDSYMDEVIFNKKGYGINLAYEHYTCEINNSLKKNAEFCTLFLDRLNYHLHNHLSTDYALSVYDSFLELYKPEIERDMKANGRTMERYNSCSRTFRNAVKARTGILLKEAKKCFNLSDSQMKEIFTDLWN